jgi:hypothetical protein
MKARNLRLAKETLSELSTDELKRVAGATDGTCATDLCNPCLFTWSCDDITVKKVCA